jgi:hypothetical protein
MLTIPSRKIIINDETNPVLDIWKESFVHAGDGLSNMIEAETVRSGFLSLPMLDKRIVTFSEINEVVVSNQAKQIYDEMTMELNQLYQQDGGSPDKTVEITQKTALVRECYLRLGAMILREYSSDPTKSGRHYIKVMKIFGNRVLAKLMKRTFFTRQEYVPKFAQSFPDVNRHFLESGNAIVEANELIRSNMLMIDGLSMYIDERRSRILMFLAAEIGNATIPQNALSESWIDTTLKDVETKIQKVAPPTQSHLTQALSNTNHRRPPRQVEFLQSIVWCRSDDPSLKALKAYWKLKDINQVIPRCKRILQLYYMLGKTQCLKKAVSLLHSQFTALGWVCIFSGVINLHHLNVLIKTYDEEFTQLLETQRDIDAKQVEFYREVNVALTHTRKEIATSIHKLTSPGFLKRVADVIYNSFAGLESVSDELNQLFNIEGENSLLDMQRFQEIGLLGSPGLPSVTIEEVDEKLPIDVVNQNRIEEVKQQVAVDIVAQDPVPQTAELYRNEKCYYKGEIRIEFGSQGPHGRGIFFDSEDNIVYEGQNSNGIFDGTGKLRIPKQGTYEGRFNQGTRKGKGKMIYNNGDVYDGEWTNNNRQGPGIMTYHNGDIYNGNWSEDQREGQGNMNYNNGDNYNGNWTKDKRLGTGNMTYSNGDNYNGEWLNDRREGQGIIDHRDRSRYEGNWLDDTKHGQGTMNYVNRDVYNGEWSKNKRQGQGTITYNNGDVYDGNWINDRREGQGTITYNNGDVYDGNWIKDRRELQGKMTYHNGDVYKGNWLKDERHGEGQMKYTNGDIYEGGWVRDKRQGLGRMRLHNMPRGVFLGQRKWYQDRELAEEKESRRRGLFSGVCSNPCSDGN